MVGIFKIRAVYKWGGDIFINFSTIFLNPTHLSNQSFNKFSIFFRDKWGMLFIIQDIALFYLNQSRPERIV